MAYFDMLLEHFHNFCYILDFQVIFLYESLSNFGVLQLTYFKMLKTADFLSHIGNFVFQSTFPFGDSYGILALHFTSYPKFSVNNRAVLYIRLLVFPIKVCRTLLMLRII